MGSGPRGPWWVGPVQKGVWGNTHLRPASFCPLEEPSFQPRACPKGEKRCNMRGPAPACSPSLRWRRGRGRGAQVARLSAGRPDMRIWELLLLRMESWVPPFTPLLARDGCRCLKSTVK